MTNCEMCQYYNYDEISDSYVCTANMDEDDYARYLQRQSRDCPFFRFQDEYKTARKQ